MPHGHAVFQLEVECVCRAFSVEMNSRAYINVKQLAEAALSAAATLPFDRPLHML